MDAAARGVGEAPPSRGASGAAVSWWRVTAPTFCAAVKMEHGVAGATVVDTAPVLRWILMRRDRSRTWLLRYAKRRRWTVERLL